MGQTVYARSKRYTLGFLLVCLSLLICGVLLILTYREKPEAAPTLGQIVGEKAKKATRFADFTLVAEESGPGYSLRFTGQMNRDVIYGHIENYNIQICTTSNIYYVKDEEMYQDWTRADEAGLEELAAFVRDPLALLNSLFEGREILVEEGPRRLVGDIPCLTYFLEIPPPDIDMFTRFKSDALLEKLQVYLWFAEETGFLHRMAVMLHLTADGEKTQLNRIYTMSPRIKELPDDLPIKPAGNIKI